MVSRVMMVVALVGVSFALSLRLPASPGSNPDPMPVAFAWTGYADTDLSFDEFFNSDHTISAWFMPQYPDSYVGPIVGEGRKLVLQDDLNPSPFAKHVDTAFFTMGTGEWGGANNSTRMALRVGDQERQYDAAFTANTWQHVAMVRSGDTFTLFLNGVALEPAITAAVSAPHEATLRVGQTLAWRKEFSKLPSQFYGLIDNLAVCRRALSSQEIALLASGRTSITASEPALLAAWHSGEKPTVKPGSAPRKVTAVGAATVTQLTKPRDNAKNAKALPLPPPHFRFPLPYTGQQLLFVGQGPTMIGGSHVGSRNFPFDISPISVTAADDPSFWDKRPVMSGVEFHSVCDGTVTLIDDGWPALDSSGHNNGTSPNHTNTFFIAVKNMPHYWWKYLHWEAGTTKLKVGDHVKTGDVLAKVGDSGLAITTHPDGTVQRNIHLHSVLVYFPDSEVPPDVPPTHTVSVPVAFTHYSVLTKDFSGTAQDHWQQKEVGVPARPEILIPSSKPHLGPLDQGPLKHQLLHFQEHVNRDTFSIPLHD